MTVLDDRQLTDWTGPQSGVRRARPVVHRPGAARPAVTPLRYSGTGVRMSRAVHSRPGVSTSVSIALAGLAALITLWLGALAQLSDERAVEAVQPDQLAVVQVQSGESLQQLAGRVAPQTPAAQVVEKIRQLNNLESSSVDAGQTLIAPIG